MKRIHLVPLSLVALLAACTTTPPPSASVVALEDGNYRIVATAQTEQLALAESLQVAQSTCRERKLQHVLSSVESRSRSAWSQTGSREEQTQQLSAYVTAPTFPSLEANDDFEVKLKFKCA